MIFSVSRPRFWMYLAGPFLVGTFFGGSIDLIAGLFFLYFLIPANIFLYGINDYFDWDTDRYNVKKGTKEYRVSQKERGTLLVWVSLSLLVGFGLFVFLDVTGFLLLAAFFFLSMFYSADPLRFKAHPFVDSISNVLYVIPGFLGYYLASGNLVPFWIVIASWFWASSMHLFSAIPDISADRKAGLLTTSVLLGKEASLWICFGLWTAGLVLLLLQVGFFFWTAAFIVYPLIPLILLSVSSVPIRKVYWLYPWINTGLGFLLFVVSVGNI